MDVSNESQVDAAMASVVDAFGQIDVLVSNAGTQIVAPLEEFAFADWKRLLAIHLDGAFLTTRAVLRQMYKQAARASSTWVRRPRGLNDERCQHFEQGSAGQ